MLISGQSDNSDRLPSFAGSFYPSDPVKLSSSVETYLKKVETNKKESKVRALIVPHAGYVYSGSTAAAAYGYIHDWSSYKRVFLIGSSHQQRFNGAALYISGDFITPLGRVKVDQNICSELQDNTMLFTNYPEVHHKEHSIEVQLPFLQYFKKDDLRIIPILVGTESPDELKKIADELKPWFTAENLFIFSSDFSHYPEYDKAVELDAITSEKIFSRSTEDFLDWIKDCEKKKSYGALTPMCGWTSGLVLMHLAGDDENKSFIHLAYSNSGDSNIGDKSGVVGYHAIALEQSEHEDLVISENEKSQLIALARDSISSWLNKRKFISSDTYKSEGILGSKLGAFVSLKLDGKLRGCIGKIHASEELIETIKQMSVAAAFNDSRFEPLTISEFERINIEISVLSKMRKVDDISDIIPGKHGIYLKKGLVTATFLPQVASEQKWNRDELLGNLAKNKAGLGWIGWKDADIYVYEAVVFED